MRSLLLIGAGCLVRTHPAHEGQEEARVGLPKLLSFV